MKKHTYVALLAAVSSLTAFAGLESSPAEALNQTEDVSDTVELVERPNAEPADTEVFTSIGSLTGKLAERYLATQKLLLDIEPDLYSDKDPPIAADRFTMMLALVQDVRVFSADRVYTKKDERLGLTLSVYHCSLVASIHGSSSQEFDLTFFGNPGDQSHPQLGVTYIGGLTTESDGISLAPQSQELFPVVDGKVRFPRVAIAMTDILASDWSLQ